MILTSALLNPVHLVWSFPAVDTKPEVMEHSRKGREPETTALLSCYYSPTGLWNQMEPQASFGLSKFRHVIGCLFLLWACPRSRGLKWGKNVFPVSYGQFIPFWTPDGWSNICLSGRLKMQCFCPLPHSCRLDPCRNRPMRPRATRNSCWPPCDSLASFSS